MRSFSDKPAVREQTPVLLGLVGPSGTGKTFSALRLATGIQRVSGGEIYVIDTEARRSLHYAEQFKFRHVQFDAPFGPLDYLSAITYAVSKGAGTIIVDSMSHEHEGPGGVLEMHEAELNRLAGNDYSKRQKWNFSAWVKPKQERRRLIGTILQLPVNVIFCFRAKEKLKIQSGRDPVNLGWQPIAGDEFVYEMTAKCFLLPGANGVPTWQSEFPGEMAMMKLPDQFRELFAQRQQLSEDIGQKIAEWAVGKVQRDPAASLAEAYQTCANRTQWDDSEKSRKALWPSLKDAAKRRLKAASDEALARVVAAEKAAEEAPKGDAREPPDEGGGAEEPNGAMFPTDQDISSIAK